MRKPLTSPIVPLGLALLVLSASCVKHVEPYKPKTRPYDLPVPMDTAPAPASTGSLWLENGPASYWSSDLRAARPNDVLTIEIDELHKAAGDAGTALQKDSSHQAKISALLGMVDAGANEDMVNALTRKTFNGGGKTQRSGAVSATVPAMVRKVSGVVRPEDINTENIVRSSRMADAQIEITGRGTVSEANGPGWLSRILDYVWPF